MNALSPAAVSAVAVSGSPNSASPTWMTCGVSAIAATSAREPGSATSSPAPEWRTRKSRSFARSISEHGIATAPTFSAASMTACHSGVLPIRTSTRSPGATPHERSTPAQRAARSPTWPNVRSSTVPSRLQKRSARRAGSWRSTTSRTKLNRAGGSTPGAYSGCPHDQPVTG